MKKFYLKATLIAFVATAFLGCSKDDASLTDNSKLSAVKADENPSAYPYPFPFPKPDSKGSELFLEPYSDYEDYPPAPYTVIENPTIDYLNETCLLDISKLEYGKAYHQLKDNKIKMEFYANSSTEDAVLKLKSNSLAGWNAPWGTLPFIEKENPDVLFSSDKTQISIVLSKPCIEFGFELAPNKQNKNYSFDALFGNAEYDLSKGLAKQQTTRTPSGARLFAVKATKPFTTITISYNKDTGTDQGSNSFAIANIRYKIAKK